MATYCVLHSAPLFPWHPHVTDSLLSCLSTFSCSHSDNQVVRKGLHAFKQLKTSVFTVGLGMHSSSSSVQHSHSYGSHLEGLSAK